MRQRQKTEAIGTLAAGIAHDFNNILFPILGYAEMSLDDVPEGSLVHQNLGQIVKATRRARDLVEQILIFSRRDERELKPLLLKPVIKETLKLLRVSLPATVRIASTLGECPPVDADPTHIHQIVMNLCTNAAHAMGNSGEIRVSLEGPESGLWSGVSLAVADSGCGISPGDLEKIFDPYFTTKPPGEGSGMGLAVVRGLVARLGGRIEVDSRPGGGSVFTVRLPLSRQTFAHQEIEAAGAVPRGSERILVIDDDIGIAEMEQQLLERLGYSVTAFTDSRAALSHFEAEAGAYDLVVTDQTMPELSGAELVRQMLAIRPQLPIILCTGFSSEVDGAKASELGVRELVMKPIETVHLGQAVRRALEG
ncbi:MAG: Wide host range VirA protein [Deltaproteobacteria bacterium ADurb.Bin510]|nr:MAG: Wide host range VirA protein [Deltaproteobacteria bacterium ADurb.Bin510]